MVAARAGWRRRGHQRSHRRTAAQTALHVALTSEGLCALDVAPDLREGFAAEFVDGMSSDAARVRRLGDVGGNDPSLWEWGVGDACLTSPCCSMPRPGGSRRCSATIEAQCAAGFECIAWLSTSAIWRHRSRSDSTTAFHSRNSTGTVSARRATTISSSTRICRLGEFLLGYPNEYGLYTPRPLLDPQRDPGGAAPRAEDAPDQADLGRNGCYLVLRQLQQDVEGFGRALDQQASGDAELRQRLAAAMVGRKKDGNRS